MALETSARKFFPNNTLFLFARYGVSMRTSLCTSLFLPKVRLLRFCLWRAHRRQAGHRVHRQEQSRKRRRAAGLSQHRGKPCATQASTRTTKQEYRVPAHRRLLFRPPMVWLFSDWLWMSKCKTRAARALQVIMTLKPSIPSLLATVLNSLFL